MNSPLLQVATSAMQAGMQQASQAAAEIAGVAKNSDASLTHSGVELLQAANLVIAAAPAVKRADQLRGTMIDIIV